MRKNNPGEKLSPTRLHCAIYTRKSTEEGLDQDFNSLDAQREAAEAFIQSQRREGWIVLPERYDDGGFTGANMERPALQRLLAAIEAAGLILPRRYPEKWVVDCKSVGSGEKALIYLGRYLYRGVIAEKDIVACGNGQVSFRYRDAKSAKMERRTVSGAHFLWLVLQHVLPKGFRRARNFGFLHPNCKPLIALLHLLLKFDPGQTMAWFKERAPIVCTCCGAVMVIVKTRIRSAFSGVMPVPIATHGTH